MRLLLFNPETEYALASGASFYTPPKRVEAIRRNGQLIPEAWARNGDIILVDDISSLKSSFRLVTWDMLADLFIEIPDLDIEPWGWNHALVRRLKDFGVPASKLPSKDKLDLIRSLAHRNTVIRLNTLWNERVSSSAKIEIPVECFSEKECLTLFRSVPGCWMKAPWSSSGRGVINTAADMKEEQVGQWCHGIIRKQGSVLVETPAKKIADYATEWRIKDKEALYLGLSRFSTSNRGKYISNYDISQTLLKSGFESLCALCLDEVVRLQKEILQEVYEGYDGLLGVDMMIEEDGFLRPFVEVNLRRTMGMLRINSD